MKINQVRKAKAIYSELDRVRQSATATCVFADSKAGRGVGKLTVEEGEASGVP